jgi:hypothetical protein
VASIAGAVAALTRLGPPTDVPAGALGYMVFEHKGSLVALRGVTTDVSSDGPELEFVVIDGVQLPERRAGERVELSARVRMFPPGLGDDADAAVESVTSNISSSGALVERRPGLGDGPDFKLELFLGGDPAPIRCGAELARFTPTHLGIKFTDMQEADRVRVGGVIFRLQRIGSG